MEAAASGAAEKGKLDSSRRRGNCCCCCCCCRDLTEEPNTRSTLLLGNHASSLDFLAAEATFGPNMTSGPIVTSCLSAEGTTSDAQRPGAVRNEAAMEATQEVGSEGEVHAETSVGVDRVPETDPRFKLQIDAASA